MIIFLAFILSILGRFLKWGMSESDSPEATLMGAATGAALVVAPIPTILAIGAAATGAAALDAASAISKSHPPQKPVKPTPVRKVVPSPQPVLTKVEEPKRKTPVELATEANAALVSDLAVAELIVDVPLKKSMIRKAHKTYEQRIVQISQML